MRKRWEFNGEALFALGIGWFVAGLVLALVTTDQGDPKVQGDSNPRLWAVLVWLGPFGLLLLAAAVYALWCWLTGEDGWFVRRVREPIREDLRAARK